MNNPISRAVDSVTGAVGDFTSGAVNKLTGAKDAVVNTAGKALDYANTVREIKRNPPTQVTIADLFHRKLYDFADFDYLLNYLRSNGISECKNIYTINTLANQVIPALTAEALKDRDVRKINATYAGVMRLCRRRRRGLLAYLSTEGHAQVCLIKTWERFLQLAAFSSTTAEQLTFNTEDVFPKLKISKSLNARVAKYNEQAIEQRKAEAEAKREAKHEEKHKQEQHTEYKTFEDIVDSEIQVTDNNTTTSLFREGQDVNFAQMLAMNYTRIVSQDANLEWDDLHAKDYFVYFLITKIDPDYKKITKIKEFLQKVIGMFDSVGFPIDAARLQQLSGNRLRDLRNALSLQTVEENAEIDDMFDTALKTLAAKYFLFDVDTSLSYKDMYLNELMHINSKRQQLAAMIKNSTNLIRVPMDSEIEEYTKYEPDFINLINTRNAEIFQEMWASAVSGNLIDLTTDGFDKLGCLLVYDKSKQIDMSLAEYDQALITTINELLPETSIDWNTLMHTTTGDIFKVSRIVRNVKVSNSNNNEFTKSLLCKALSVFYNFRVNEKEIWQQIYMGICNAKKSMPRAGLTISSAAEQLGLIESADSTQLTADELLADIDNMEL